MKPARRRVWPWIVIGTPLLVLLIALVAAFLVSSNAKRRWSELRARQAVLLPEAQAIGNDRVRVTEGPAVPGNGMDDYLAAASALEALTEAERSCLAAAWDRRDGSKPPTPEELVRWTSAQAAAEPALDLVREGARREHAKFRFEWNAGWEATLPPMGTLRLAMRALVVEAGHKRREGLRDAAFVDLAAAWQLSLDLMRVPGLICLLVGHAGVDMATDEARHWLDDPNVAPERRLALEELLARTDLAIPRPADALLQEQAIINQSMRRCIEGGGSLAEFGLGDATAFRMSLWRQGFSVRIAAEELDRHYARLVVSVRDAESRPWAEARAAIDAAETCEDNFLARLLLPASTGVCTSDRFVRARLRVLRAALMLRRGAGPGDAAWPVDPFTQGPVGTKSEGGRTIVWSPQAGGPNTGTGRWSLDRDMTEDLVLEAAK